MLVDVKFCDKYPKAIPLAGTALCRLLLRSIGNAAAPLQRLELDGVRSRDPTNRIEMYMTKGQYRGALRNFPMGENAIANL